MAKKIDPATKIVSTTLALVAAGGWHQVSIARIAGEAGLKLTDVAALVRDRQGLLDLIGQAVDDAALAEGAVDPTDNPRDRLFEVMMRRFDYLEDHREAFVALTGVMERDPALALRQIVPLERSMALMLDLAGMPAQGVLGAIKIRVLTAIYLDIVRTWRKDDSGELARTMKALDRRLNQAEQWANTFERPGSGGGLGGLFRRRKQAAPPADAPTGAEEG